MSDALLHPQVLGYEVVEPTERPDQTRRLSRRYVVRQAADEFAKLAKACGHPGAMVREVIGFEGAK